MFLLPTEKDLLGSSVSVTLVINLIALYGVIMMIMMTLGVVSPGPGGSAGLGGSGNKSGPQINHTKQTDFLVYICLYAIM